MNISWNISDEDIQNIKKIVRDNENPFLLMRRQRNVYKKNIVINKDIVIKTMIMCLLTSQQRSGPNSVVGQFLLLDPFPINLDILSKTDNVEPVIKKILIEKGLTRYINRVSQFFAANFKKLQKENWKIIEELEYLQYKDSQDCVFLRFRTPIPVLSGQLSCFNRTPCPADSGHVSCVNRTLYSSLFFA